jgi:signal transduction histidine kinase
LKKNINSLLILAFATVSLWSQSVTDSLLVQLKQATADTLKVKLYIELGKELSNENPKNALLYFNQSIQLAKKQDNFNLLAKSHKAIGNFYYDKSDYADALTNFKLAQIYFEKALNEKETGNVLLNIGNVYLAQSIDGKAYEYFLKALKIAEKFNHLKGIASAYNNIGLIYKDRHDATKALDFFNKSLKISTQLNDKNGISSVNTNIGNVYADEKKYHLAINYYHKSLDIDTELDDKFGMIICYNNIGEIYSKQHDLPSAKPYFENGIQIAKEIGNKSMLALLYLNLSSLNLEEKQLTDALNNATISLKFAKLTDELKAQAHVYELFSKISVVQNNHKNAYEFHQLFKKYNDSLTTSDKLMKINELDIIYDAENKISELQSLTVSNKQNEIQIDNQRIMIYGFVFLIFIVIVFSSILFKQNLEKVKMNSLLTLKSLQIEEKNKEIIEQHNDLEQLNNTKDKFFSIIGHDLKNPMNSIIGFSELLLDNYKTYDDEKRHKFINIIKNSAHRSNELLENLLSWAQSQSNSIEFNPTKLPLKNSIEEVFGLLNAQASKKGISLQSNFAVNCHVIADKNMLLTILRNLVSNAIKFSNSNSVVSIVVTPREQFCEITVKDTGLGIPENEIEYLFDMHNKDKISKKAQSGSGLGLMLCKDFIQKQGGTIWVNSKLNQGSVFTFTLPIANS